MAATGEDTSAVAAPKTPADFLQSIKGKPVVVKLNSGVDYRGATPPLEELCFESHAQLSEQVAVLYCCAVSSARPDANLHVHFESYAFLLWPSPGLMMCVCVCVSVCVCVCPFPGLMMCVRVLRWEGGGGGVRGGWQSYCNAARTDTGRLLPLLRQVFWPAWMGT